MGIKTQLSGNLKNRVSIHRQGTNNRHSDVGPEFNVKFLLFSFQVKKYIIPKQRLLLKAEFHIYRIQIIYSGDPNTRRVWYSNG